MKKIISLLLLSFALSSCNTTIGVARDMRQAGEGLEKAAQGKQGASDTDSAAPTY